MSKRKKRDFNPGQQNLIHAKIVLPTTYDREEMRLVLSEIRSLCTRYTVGTPKDGKIMVETWCTPKQAHRLQNFARSVLQAKQYDEGYDLAEVRRELEEHSQGHPDDRFLLPQDTHRLSMQAAAAGMQTALLNAPGYREEDEVKTIATKICDLAPELWPEGANDFTLYREIFIPAHVDGYKYGMQVLAHMGAGERLAFTEKILDDAVRGNGPRYRLSGL